MPLPAKRIPEPKSRAIVCLHCRETFPRWKRKSHEDDQPVSGVRLRDAHTLSVHADRIGA